jgi:hypothetical protein
MFKCTLEMKFRVFKGKTFHKPLPRQQNHILMLYLGGNLIHNTLALLKWRYLSSGSNHSKFVRNPAISKISIECSASVVRLTIHWLGL